MKVVAADAMGMCFGVRRTLEVLDRIPDPREVTIHGELVHNASVVAGLTERGFRMTDEEERGAPETPGVLITPHGISDRERHTLDAAGRTILDTTCPLVTRAHRAALGFRDDGRFVVVVGRRSHVEIRGLTGDLHEFDVVEGPDDVRRYDATRLGVVFQTTTAATLAKRVRRAIETRNETADIEYADTICHPTLRRQEAMTALGRRVDLVVVVGGRNSNNTRELVRRARELGLAAHHVERAMDLRSEWFVGRDTVGLTAGTSTPPEVISEVRAALASIEPAAVACGAGLPTPSSSS